jgi:hypothetical protein
LPFGLTPAGGMVDPASDPGLAEPDVVGEEGEEGEEQPAVTEMVRELQRGELQKNLTQRRRDAEARAARATNEGKDCEGECRCSFEDVTPRAGDGAEAARWKKIVSRQRAHMRLYHGRIRNSLMDARREVLRKIEAQGPLLLGLGATQTRALAADFIFDLLNWQKGLQVSLRGTAAAILQEAGAALVKEELGKDDPWKMPPAEALKFLRERENKIAGAAAEVHGTIMGELQEGIDKGDTTAELAGRVKAAFNEIADGRALTIARTETSMAYGTARQQAMQDVGIQWKKWLTSGNDNVRSAHRAMNNQVVGIHEKFTVVNPKTGEWDQVEHPGDPGGAPWNVINCHCVSVATESGPEGEVVEPN